MIYMSKIRPYTVHAFLKSLFSLAMIDFSSYDRLKKNTYIRRDSISSIVLIETGPLLWARKKKELTP